MSGSESRGRLCFSTEVGSQGGVPLPRWVPLTLFPYCITWLVLVCDFTSWYCRCSVSLVRSSYKMGTLKSLGSQQLQVKPQPAGSPEGLTTSESSIQLTLYQSPR